MRDNEVSEKAIWEGFITPDSDTPSFSSQMQSQPQMMFCFKCNNVIPSNSTYCPYCQVKLFTECPKCGAKYSSQYPACNHCGTNREEYLQMQRRETERKAAIERENRHRQETEERKRKEAEEEKERQERLKRYEREASERQQKAAYIKENAEIIKTKEYETTYSLLNEALECFEEQRKQKRNIAIFLYIVYFLFVTIVVANVDLSLMVQNIIIETFILISPGIAMGLMFVSIFTNLGAKKKVKFILRHIKKRNVGYDKHMMEYVISKILAGEMVDASKCCIEAYRINNNLPVDYK